MFRIDKINYFRNVCSGAVHKTIKKMVIKLDITIDQFLSEIKIQRTESDIITDSYRDFGSILSSNSSKKLRESDNLRDIINSALYAAEVIDTNPLYGGSYQELCLRHPYATPHMLKFYLEFIEQFPDSKITGIKEYSEWLPRYGKFIDKTFRNAVKHGNQKDTNKKVTITRHYGENMFVFSIADEGDGFNVEESVTKFRNKDRSYISPGGLGSGFSTLDQKGVVVVYNPKGNEVYIKIPLGPKNATSNIT